MMAEPPRDFNGDLWIDTSGIYTKANNLDNTYNKYSWTGSSEGIYDTTNEIYGATVSTESKSESNLYFKAEADFSIGAQIGQEFDGIAGYDVNIGSVSLASLKFETETNKANLYNLEGNHILKYNKYEQSFGLSGSLPGFGVEVSRKETVDKNQNTKTVKTEDTKGFDSGFFRVRQVEEGKSNYTTMSIGLSGNLKAIFGIQGGAELGIKFKN